jgi:hypothetical protein
MTSNKKLLEKMKRKKESKDQNHQSESEDVAIEQSDISQLDEKITPKVTTSSHRRLLEKRKKKKSAKDTKTVDDKHESKAEEGIKSNGEPIKKKQSKNKLNNSDNVEEMGESGLSTNVYSNSSRSHYMPNEQSLEKVKRKRSKESYLKRRANAKSKAKTRIIASKDVNLK